MLSTKLETLRDMSHENYIEPSQLTKIKTIGGGAFASGVGLLPLPNPLPL